MGSVGNKTIVHVRSSFFEQKVFDRLPKSLKSDNIIDIGKEKTMDGTRYSATIEYDDGEQRSISEYSWSEFKYYLEQVLKDRRYSQ